MTEVLFWFLISGVVWTYAGYPLLLVILARFTRRILVREPIEPSVTLIIAAHNEEKHIRKKLESVLQTDYPPPKLQIIVASDCSTDGTHEIVREFASQGVELVILPERRGKTAAQNAAARTARGEVIVFTDATTQFHNQTIRRLVETFADPRVGCVGAELEYVTPEGTPVGKGGSAYWRYERKLKELESQVNSLIGVSGCLYGVRASAYSPIDPDLISDFVVASDVFAKGYVTAYGRGAVAEEETHEEPGQEFDMRVRVAIRSIHALVRRVEILNPFRYGFYSVQLFSHKVLRYLVPELLLGILALNVGLVIGESRAPSLYRWMLGGQLAVYLAALLGWVCVRFRIRPPLLNIPFYFVHANAAAFWALIRYLGGERKVTWSRSVSAASGGLRATARVGGDSIDLS